MAVFNLNLPAFDRENLGDAHNDRQILDYLFSLNRKLEYMFHNIGQENLDAQTAERLKSAARSAGNAQAIAQQLQESAGVNQAERKKLYDSLYNQIVHTASEITNAYLSEITASSQRLESSFSETYTAKSDTAALKSEMESRMEQTAQQITLSFSTANEYTVEVDEKLNAFVDEMRTYIRFSGEGIELGKLGSLFTSLLGNEKLSFMQSGVEIAYISNNKMYITDAEITGRLTLGNSNLGYYDWQTETNGSLSLVRRG